MGVVLFLGAGVSMGSKIPSWRNLAENVLKNVGYNNYQQIEKAAPTFIAQFDLAANALCKKLGEKEGRRAFTTELYRCLYGEKFQVLKGLLEDIPKGRDEQKKWEKWSEVKEKLKDNITLAAVGDLLVSEGKAKAQNCLSDSWSNNYKYRQSSPHLLSGSIRRRQGVDDGRSRSVGDHPTTIPIYHLHGYLDARGENFLPERRTKSGKKVNVHASRKRHGPLA